MSEIKAAIFDLDGTLVDSMYVWHKVDVDFLSQRGFEVPDDYSKAIKTMHFETAAEYTIARFKLNETVEEVVSVWLSMAINEYTYNVKLKSGARELIEKLSDDGMRFGIATSSKPFLAEPVLKNNGIYDYFDSICYTSQVGKDKRHPDIYLFTADKLGVKPSECVVFEDIVDGINGANSAGMCTVAVYDNESSSEKETLKHLADKYIMSFDELL